MTPVPRPEQGAATLRQALGAVLDEHIGWQMHRGQMVDALAEAAEAILAARQPDTGLREAVEAWEVSTRRAAEATSVHSESDGREKEAVLAMLSEVRTLLARFPATPEPEATEVEEWGVRCQDPGCHDCVHGSGAVATTESVARRIVAHTPDRTLMRRRVTEWEEVDG